MESSYKKVPLVNPHAWTEKVRRDVEVNYFLPGHCRGGTVVDCGCNVGGFELVHGDRFDMYHCLK